jgi:NADPH:quinone reductase-like Zn-dependent oxidoreductase
MKAMMFNRYGSLDGLQLHEIEKPVPAEDQVLVRVAATSVNYSTMLMITGKVLIARMMLGGLFKPKYTIPGNDIAGWVEAVGAKVTHFKPGDPVFGDTSEAGFGTFAEYAAVSETALTHKPDGVSFEDAAAAPEAALVALQGLRDLGRIEPGQKVLIVGASGGIGTFAVQLAKHFGAEVTAVCSTRNIDLVRALGADHAIDYTQTDFTRVGQKFDLILATLGYRPIADYRRMLTPQGRYVSTGGELKQVFEALLLGPVLSRSDGKTFSALTLKTNKDLELIGSLLESGAIRSVIDRCYPLIEAAEALRYYSTGRARGKIIISIAPQGA